MDTHTLDPLVRLCAEQERRFDPGAWRESESVDRRTLAVAAGYLSMTSWYGHEAALEHVAEALCPGISSVEGFHREAVAIGFDLSYFSAAVRYRVAIIDRNLSLAGRNAPRSPDCPASS